jgi:hypothetical protein
VARNFARFTREELQFLIAQDLQAALPELVYVTRIVQEQATRPAPRDEIRKRIHEVSGMTLAKYRETIALPVWKVQAGEPHSDLDSFITRGSMAPIVDRLRDDARVHVLHNADDVMAEERSIQALKAALGDQMTLYPHGGHLGNLWYPDNREAILRFLR